MSYTPDVTIITPFVDGTINTLKVQCGIVASPEPGFIVGKGKERPMEAIDIAGIIGITSDQFKGTISIGFPEKTFLLVMGKMLGETYTELTKDLEDGAGELINIIFGSAKRTLNDKGYTLQKALPSVVRGKNIQVRPLTKLPTMILPFKTECGGFQIVISVEPS